jgi:ribosome-binding protein aMBF1 (putative translation factor)
MKRSSKSKSAWREGTVQEFLDLSESQAALIRTKAALAVRLQRRRTVLGWSQTELAQRIGSGQSRIAKMEAAHPSVSLELLAKALLATGASMAEIGSRRPAAPK